MTAWYRTRFLFCSFGPLYLLLCVGLAVQHIWKRSNMMEGDAIAMALAGVAFIFSLITFAGLRSGFTSSSPMRYQVEPMESLDESVLGYMLSYIPPLMIDDLSSSSKVAPAVVFYFVLLTIMIRNDSMYVNPYFLLFKYRIYRVRLPSGRAVVVITRDREILPKEVLTLHEIQPAKLFYAS